MTAVTAPNIFDLQHARSRKAKRRSGDAAPAQITALHPARSVTVTDEEARMFDIASGLNIAITFSDPGLPDCPVVFANPAFERLTGYSTSAISGSNCRFLQGPATDRTQVAKIRRAVELCAPCDVVLLNYRASGEAFHNLLVIRPIWLSDERCLLMGSQYEFSFGARREEIERNCYSRFDDAEEMSQKLRDLENTSRESLLIRSEAAAVRIETAMLRRRVGL